MDNIKGLLRALALVENDRQIPQDVIVEALKEAMAKAYKKQVELSDIMVRVDITPKGAINVFHQYTVSEEVFDDEIEISLEDARELNPDAQYGDIVERKVKIDNFSRAAATAAKSVMKQKIREAEKKAVYDEYHDLKGEMVIGTVETVEEKFALVNLGKTIAILPKSQQVESEKIYEGQQIRVIITEVNQETKKSQVTVSRTDALLVKRLFEKEVPEIYQGVVEIKAIAREAGERTKIAVVSHNPDVDAIGSCIGPRGARVQNIINEVNGEKMDIFAWNDNITDLVKNALAPATVIAVVPELDNKNVTVVVDEKQLSLAIGKHGKNARLAVKLCNKKIDIKTEADLIAAGIDYREKLMAYNVEMEKQKRQKAAEALAALKKEAEKPVVEEVELDTPVVEETPVEEVTETIEETVTEAVVEETVAEETVEEKVEDVVVEKTVTKEEVKPTPMKRKPLEKKTEYVSKFEKLADTTKGPEKNEPKRKFKKKDDDDHKLRAKDILSNIDVDYDYKPVYSEEELEEIRIREEEEEFSKYDIDYDEYEEYYDED